jgi:rhamnosyltransferase
MPAVSIVIRSCNDIEYIDKTLDMIQKQCYQDFELVNVDSGSTDGTFEIVKKYNPNAYQINPKDYIPGKVLNAAVRKCSGEIIVFNNSDCIPQDTSWLENLISPFKDSTNTVAVYGNQIPRKDADPLVVKDNTRAFGDGQIASTWFHFFSLATSAVRKSTIEQYPFDPDIQYSEDIEWSYRMKKQGFEIVYAADAIVEHSHNYTLKEVKKRFYNEGLAEGKIYGLKKSFLIGFILPCMKETVRDTVYLLKKGKILTIPNGIIYRVLQRYYAYKGRKDYFRNHER